MEIKRVVLEQLPIYRLREIGRERGVKSPSSLSKGELINEIIKIKSGETKPTFSKRGRPTLNTSRPLNNEQELKLEDKIAQIDNLFSQVRSEIIKILFSE